MRKKKKKKKKKKERNNFDSRNIYVRFTYSANGKIDFSEMQRTYMRGYLYTVNKKLYSAINKLLLTVLMNDKVVSFSVILVCNILTREKSEIIFVSLTAGYEMRGQAPSHHLLGDAPYATFRSPAPAPEPIDPPPWALVKEVPGKMYLCETVERVTRHRRTKHRIWIIKSSILVIVDSHGKIRRMNHVGGIQDVFVSERPSGCWRIIIIYVDRANEPTQVIDLPLEKEPEPVLQVINSIYVAHTGKNLSPVYRLHTNVDVHGDPDIYGPFEKEKIVNYLSPLKKKELWATDRPNYKARPPTDRDDEEKLETPEHKEDPKSVFEDANPESGSESDFNEEKVTFDTLGASQLHLERRRRSQAEKRAWKAEIAANALADQLSKRRLTSSSTIIVTNLRTEGIDSAIKRCLLCSQPYTPFCCVSGNPHDSDDLIITMFTVRQSQHVTGISSAGVCNYDIAHWKPYPISQDRIITISVVSANQLLGKAGVIVTDLLPDENSTSSPILWEQGIPMKLNGRPVGKLKIRCVLWNEDDHSDSRWSLFECIASSGQHALHTLPGGPPVHTIKTHDRMVVEEVTTIDNELWGRVGGFWTIIKNSQNQIYMQKVGYTRPECGRCMLTAALIISAFAVEKPPRGEEKASFSLLNFQLGSLERDVRKMHDKSAYGAEPSTGMTTYNRSNPNTHSGSVLTASTFTREDKGDIYQRSIGGIPSHDSSHLSHPTMVSVRKVTPRVVLAASNPSYLDEPVFQSPSPSHLEVDTSHRRSAPVRYDSQYSRQSECFSNVSVPQQQSLPVRRQSVDTIQDQNDDRIYVTVHSENHINSHYSSTASDLPISL